MIYKAEIKFTGMVDHGFGLKSLTSGEGSIPPAGARFDQTFQGVHNGPEIRGLIDGIDFLYVRPDGTFHSHLHEEIIMEERVSISLFSEGVSLQQEFSREALLRTSASLFISSASYLWLNRLQLWAAGSLNLEKGAASMRAYSVLDISKVSAATRCILLIVKEPYVKK